MLPTTKTWTADFLGSDNWSPCSFPGMTKLRVLITFPATVHESHILNFSQSAQYNWIYTPMPSIPLLKEKSCLPQSVIRKKTHAPTIASRLKRNKTIFRNSILSLNSQSYSRQNSNIISECRTSTPCSATRVRPLRWRAGSARSTWRSGSWRRGGRTRRWGWRRRPLPWRRAARRTGRWSTGSGRWRTPAGSRWCPWN